MPSDHRPQGQAPAASKKTSFQKQKEAEDLKKKKEMEETARAYADFVASFTEDNSLPFGGKGWVKGGTIVPSTLSDRPASSSDAPSRSSQLYLQKQRFVSATEKSEPPAAPATAAPALDASKASKKRNLDTFLEEIKREQEEQEIRLKSKSMHTDSGDRASLTLKAAFEEKPGSHDMGDPDTTNLYVGNINPAVNEEMLCREFAVYGPIASVKIMWPRTPEERERNRNCGFVSFMKREDAAAALKALDGKDILGYSMRLGWGKAIALPPRPVYVLEKGAQNLQTGLPFNASPSTSQPGSSRAQPRLEVQVVRPSDHETVMLIHRTVEFVILHGPLFEALIMDRELNNPRFTFLFKNDSIEHIYYRWRLFSVLQGDGKNRWRLDAFRMFDEGPYWVPPEIPFDDEYFAGDESDSSVDSVESSSSNKAPQRRMQKGALLPAQRAKLERMLRKITMTRGDIGRAMIFCINHSDAADKIVEIITKSLMIAATPVFPTKISRLFLVSDILHNCGTSIPNAWKYRAAFEQQLPAIFEHLSSVWRKIGGRLRAEQMRKAVYNILNVWEDWMIFSKEYTDQLRSMFTYKAVEDEEPPQAMSDGFQSRLKEQQSMKIGVWAMGDDDSASKAEGSPASKWKPVEPASEGSAAGGGFKPSKWKSVDSDVSQGGTPQSRQDTPAAATTETAAELATDEDEDDEDIDGVPLNLHQAAKTHDDASLPRKGWVPLTDLR